MDESTWDRVKTLFGDALQKPPAERGAFLTDACGEDHALRQQIESLIAAHEEAGAFLDAPTQLADPTPPSDDEMPCVPLGAQPGDRIGRYKLLQRIGEGGFGTVFMAEQQEPVRRKVALKIIKLGMDTKQVVARFEAERQALAMMDHPNIARVFDGGATDTGRPYFVMELVTGEPITKYSDDNLLSTKDRLDLFVAVCRAVQHAHQKGIIHRDIKPTNVLVTLHDGVPVPKVIDFGIAKATEARLTEKTLFTEHKQMVGTPAYMSPEQAEMSGLDIDTRTDVYSLGVLLYELLTGTTPFDAASLRHAAFGEMQRIIREEEPPRPSTRLSTLGKRLSDIARQRRVDASELSRQLRGDLDWIVMKALEKDRRRRYETAAAIAEDIARHLADEPVVAGPPGAGYRFGKFMRRNRSAVAVAATIVLALAVGLVLATVGLVRAERAEAEAVDQRDRANREASIVQAVNDFLTKDLLAGVDPENTADREITMREVLDRAADKIDGRFPNAPLVEAAVRVTIGRIYRSLGLYEQAQPHLERAVEIREDSLGDDDPATMRALNHLAFLYDLQGRSKEAVAIHKRLLDIRLRTLGEEDHDTLASMNNLGQTLCDQGRYDEAEPLLKRALEIRRRTLGDDAEDTLVSVNALASLYWDQGMNEKAEPLYVEALAGRRRTLGDDHPQTLTAMNNLATVYIMSGRFDEAEKLLTEQIERSRRVLGDAHPDTLTSINNLGAIYYRRGNYEKSADTFAELLATMRKSMPPGHYKIGQTLGNYGHALFRLKRYAEAETALLEAYDIFVKAFGPDHASAVGIADVLVSLYTQWGKPDQAVVWRARLAPTSQPTSQAQSAPAGE